MKKHLSKKALWLSLLSAMVLGVFILLAVGSGILILPTTMVPIGNGLWKETYFSLSYKRVTTGKVDDFGNWVGNTKIEWIGHKGVIRQTEETIMYNGKREGESTYTFPDKTTKKIWYHADIRMPKYKATYSNTLDISAFQILGDKYPWFLLSLNACYFDSVYVEAYMDTVETLLNTYEFEVAEFDNYYEDILDELEETPYDSLIVLNSNLFLIKGMEEIKTAELRMAVIDRYRSEGITTYSIVNNTYPGYLRSLNDSAVTNHDFEEFCQDMDSCMDSYGPLNPEDTLFLDSLDARMSRALYAIISVEDSTSSSIKRSMKNTAPAFENHDFRSLYSNVNLILKPSILKSTPSEVGVAVVSFMMLKFIQGDILRRAFREAYFLKKGIISVPTVATVFSGSNSATSVTLQGYVIENGGAEVTSRGIAWATFYNPTINDNSVTPATGTEEFTVEVTGLTEGVTYYARTYATNSAGTAYGNCIKFIATNPSGIIKNKIYDKDLIIYPNPASSSATVSFQVNSAEGAVLTMIDMKGQVVFIYDLGRLPQGKNQIGLDLSSLRNGIYTCQLTNGTAKVTCKLVIDH